MPIKRFAATGSPGILVPSTRQLIVETLSVQVDVTPPGTRLEAFVNYKSAGQDSRGAAGDPKIAQNLN
jgi:hypothetical protein